MNVWLCYCLLNEKNYLSYRLYNLQHKNVYKTLYTSIFLKDSFNKIIFKNYQSVIITHYLMSNFLFLIIIGFSIYFYTTQLVSLNLTWSRISTNVFKHNIPLPLDSLIKLFTQLALKSIYCYDHKVKTNKIFFQVILMYLQYLK